MPLSEAEAVAGDVIHRDGTRNTNSQGGTGRLSGMDGSITQRQLVARERFILGSGGISALIMTLSLSSPNRRH